MAFLTEPLAMCVEFLVPKIARPLFEKSMKRILQTIEHLRTDDFRDKVRAYSIVLSGFLDTSLEKQFLQG